MDEQTMERLEELEQQIEERMEQRRLILQESCGEAVENYSLKNTEGESVPLSSLFDGKEDLIVVHNMGKNCTYCTLWADGFNGVAQHLADRAGFALVSPDSPEVQKEFAEGRDWRFPTYSAEGSSFIGDMGFTMTNDEGKTFYLPGYSTFRKEEDGTIRRTGRDFFGPMDMYAGIWHMFAMFPKGADGWHPKFSYEENVEA